MFDPVTVKTVEPTLSILVPTRNRHETLPYTLTTLSKAASRDLEFLICDNSDVPFPHQTLPLDERFRFIRPPNRLGMTENWDYCLLDAKGTYRTFIGDDDGVLPNSLDKLVAHLRRGIGEVVVAQNAGYVWPQFGRPAVLQLLRSSPQGRDIKSTVLKELQSFRCSNFFPMPYNRAVFSRSIEQRIRTESKGSFFSARTPDINAGALLALFATSIEFFETCVFIAGASATSNGTQATAGNFSEDFFTLTSIPFLPELGDGMNSASHVQYIEPMVQAMRCYGLKSEISKSRIIFRIFFSTPKVGESRSYCLRTWPSEWLLIRILSVVATTWHMLTWKMYLTRDTWRPLLFGNSEFVSFNSQFITDVTSASDVLERYLASPLSKQPNTLRYRVLSPRRLLELKINHLSGKNPTGVT